MDWKKISGIFRHPPGEPAARPPIAEGGWVTGSVRVAAGSRKYKLWVPAAADEARSSVPLVMMLHGCSQKPEDLAEISGMNGVADKNGFLVVYPEQPLRANLLHCWNWYDPKHQSRGGGEPSILAAIVEEIGATHPIDRERVYVGGISAGAAMAIVLGATYPDVFRGIGAVAGVAFGAANSLRSGLATMKHGGPDPARQGLAAFEAMNHPSVKNPPGRMPVIVFHGDADRIVNPVNAEQVIAQWARTNQLLDGNQDGDAAFDASSKFSEGQKSAGRPFRKYSYKDAGGRLRMEQWIVEGMGHAWPGSPQPGEFADPRGPNASQEMWRFFSGTAEEPPPAQKTLWDRFTRLLHR
jgi:poly(hydroxyalkanoate) depolymerase family esterase